MITTRRIVFSLFLLLFTVCSVKAQQNRQFERALDLYKQQEYQEAARIFLSQSENPEATLFGGKSLFGAGHYIQALNVLNPILAEQSVNQDIRLETHYTLGLAYMQLSQFEPALKHLNQVKTGAPNKNIGLMAANLYNELLHYLTLPQRLAIFRSTDQALLRRDLIQSALDHIDSTETQTLLKAYRNSYYSTDNMAVNRSYPIIQYDSLTYPELPLRVPNGIIHDVGVPLPNFEPGTSEFNVTQSLYFGMLMAAEEFNRRNNDQKVFLRHHKTNKENTSLDDLATEWIWNQGIDVILGPLTSESAESLSYLAEQYQIPLIAPLANSDSLNLDNPYVFQTNPTFAVRGREMAQHAVKSLELDTLAIIVERNSLGAQAAYAFRQEAERLGAFVPYFFADNFAEQGYDLSDYRDYFNSDSTLRDSLNIINFEAVYAPFTGRAAATMVDLFLTDLEAGRSEVTILGSQEWMFANLSDERIERFDIYYPTTFALDDSSDTVKRFKADYQSRFDLKPTQFSYIGYNTADYLFKTLEQSGNPALLKQALKQQPRYKGLGADIVFEGTHINSALKIFKMKPESTED